MLFTMYFGIVSNETPCFHYFVAVLVLWRHEVTWGSGSSGDCQSHQGLPGAPERTRGHHLCASWWSELSGGPEGDG